MKIIIMVSRGKSTHAWNSVINVTWQRWRNNCKVSGTLKYFKSFPYPSQSTYCYVIEKRGKGEIVYYGGKPVPHGSYFWVSRGDGGPCFFTINNEISYYYDISNNAIMPCIVGHREKWCPRDIICVRARRNVCAKLRSFLSFMAGFMELSLNLRKPFQIINTHRTPYPKGVNRYLLVSEVDQEEQSKAFVFAC